MVIRKLKEISENYKNTMGKLQETYCEKYQYEKGHRNYQQGSRENEDYNFWIEEHSIRNQSKVEESKDRISELEDKVEKYPQKEQEKEKRLKKNEEVSREWQDSMKHNNIHKVEIPEGEEEQVIANMFAKRMMKSFPYLMTKNLTQVQQAQRVPIKRNWKRPTPRHIIIKMAKFKDRES